MDREYAEWVIAETVKDLAKGLAIYVIALSAYWLTR